MPFSAPPVSLPRDLSEVLVVLDLEELALEVLEVAQEDLEMAQDLEVAPDLALERVQLAMERFHITDMLDTMGTTVTMVTGMTDTMVTMGTVIVGTDTD